MTKDKRYQTVKHLISSGYIKSFTEIFDTLPKSLVYKDLGMNSVRFNNLLRNVDRFVLKDLFKIAALIEIEEHVLLELILHDYYSQKKKGKGSGKKG